MKKEPIGCVDVCLEAIAMLKVAGENLYTETYNDTTGNLIRRKVCETNQSGINHDELLNRLKKYKLTKEVNE